MFKGASFTKNAPFLYNKFLIIPNAISINKDMFSILLCNLSKLFSPVFIYTKIYFKNTNSNAGIRINNILLLINALWKSSFIKAKHIEVTPQPGHLKPVKVLKRQGILSPVLIIKILYIIPLAKTINIFLIILNALFFIFLN